MRFGVSTLAALLCASLSYGQTFTWTNVGTNDWGTATNWGPPTVPNNLATHIAAFGPQAAPLQPNVAAQFSVLGVTMDNSLGSWNLTGAPGNLVNLGTDGIDWTGGGATTLSANLNIATVQVWDVGTTTVTVGGAPQGALFGVSSLAKLGSGTLILDSGTGLFAGDINVVNGVLQAGSAGNNAASQALRSSPVSLVGTTVTTVGSTADLRIGSLNSGIFGFITPATGGAVHLLDLNGGFYGGSITTTGGLNLRGGNGTVQDFSGDLTALTGTIGINSGATMRLSGNLIPTSGVLGSVALAPRGGSLVLDNTGGNTVAATGRLADTAATTFVGGTLSLLGNSAGTIETIGTIALQAGAASVSVTHNGGVGGTAIAFTDSGAIRDSTAMTVNFIGNGGTLGTAGANPRVTFSGALFTGTNTLMLANSAGSDTTIGWAIATTANDTNWAGFSAATGIIPLANVSRDETTIGGAVAFERTLYAPNAIGALAAPISVGALKIQPNAAGLSLALGANAITTTALLFTGTNDFTITSTGGALFGAASGTRYFHIIDPNVTLFNGASVAGANQPFNKSGPGFLDFNGSINQIAFGTAQSINILEGVLRGTATSLGGFTSAGGAFTNINLYGGTLELSGGGTFVRALDLTGTAAGGAIRIDSGATTRGDPGLSAINGDMAVTFVTLVGGAIPSNLVWNDGAFVPDGHVLKFGSTKSDSRIELTNNVGLDTGLATASYFGREIRVTDNSMSANDYARLSGVISGSSNADLIKTGLGTLELTNSNTYAGNTQVLQGTLRANNALGSATGTGNVIVRNGGTLSGNGFVVPNNSGGNQVTIQGTVAPGNSVGTLTIGSLVTPATVTAPGIYAFELSTAGATAAPNTGGSSGLGVHDLVTIFGTLDVSALVINPASLGLSGFDNTLSYSWTVATATGGITGLPGPVSLGTGTEFAGMAFFTGVIGNNLYLNFSPVPEPATVLAFAAAGLGVGGLIRRRFRKS